MLSITHDVTWWLINFNIHVVSPLTSPFASPATGPPGSQCVGNRSSWRKHQCCPAAFVSRPRPLWPGVLPGLHPGAAFKWRREGAGGAKRGSVWCCCGIRGCGTSGWLGNIRHLLQPRSEGVLPRSLSVVFHPKLHGAGRVSFTWVHLNMHMVILLFASVFFLWE